MSQPSKPRPRPTRLRLVGAVAASLAILTGCTSSDGDDGETSTSPSVAESSEATSASPSVPPPSSDTAPSTTAPTSPEDQAAADAEAAYRRYLVESQRHIDTAIREAAAQGGVYVRTEQLDAILVPVAVGEVFQGRVELPAGLLQTYPTAASAVGEPVVLELEPESVQLFDAPQTIQGREGVTGEVVLQTCIDVTPVGLLDAQGQSLTPTSPGSRIQTGTVTVSQQPHPRSGAVGWYVAEGANAEGTSCEH